MYRTWLIPYLEGMLSASQRAELEARLTEDPELAAELDRMRCILPRLRASLRPSVMLSQPTDPVWPRLCPQLGQPGPRRRLLTPAWRAAGLACAILLLASSLSNRETALRSRRADLHWIQVLHHAPLIVFHRDNMIETPAAARLQRHALHVAAEREAAS